MAGGPPAYPQEIRELSFYFDNFANSDEAAHHVIRNNRGPGTFLLRPSFRSRGVLTLTISVDDSMARHVNVQFRADERSPSGFNFFIIPERSFFSFHELYNFYSLHTICNVEMVSNVRLLNPIERPQDSPAEAGAAAAAAPAFPFHGPMVTSDEIPPIPRKQSVSSWTGSMEAVPPIPEEDGRMRSKSQSQPGFPEIPPIPVSARPDRPSLDSQGNDNAAFSSSSGSGSEAAARGGRLGAINDLDLQPPQYLAPGSPGTRKSSTSWGTLPASFRNNRPDPTAALPAAAATLSKKELKEQKEMQKKLEKQAKEKIGKKDRKKLEKMKTRAPMPIPGAGGDPQSIVDEPPYYSTPKPHKNKIDDLKKMLRESEMCDCGLRMMDAELVQGWTVHRSRDNGTYLRVFYQHDDGNTTWHFPDSITHQLSDAQVKFVIQLCRDGSHEVPAALHRRYQMITSTGPGRGATVQPSSSFNSSRSRSSSNSSDHFGSSLSLSRSPPTFDPRSPGPGDPGKRE